MTSTGLVAADWRPLGDSARTRYYRKWEVFEMSWADVDLRKLVAAAAPFGGPIALVRNEKMIINLEGQSLRPAINIYSSAGLLNATIVWEKGRIVTMGWTDKEQLVIVCDDGAIWMYNLHGEFVRHFSMGGECIERKVVEAIVWATGLVCLTGNNQLYTVSSFDEPRPQKLAILDLTEPPTAIAVLEPQYTLSQSVEIFVATASGTILVVDADTVEDQLITNGPFTRMAVSPNGKVLACFTETGNLWVVTCDFTKNYSGFGTKARLAPLQLVWCGTDSVILYWERVLLMVGPHGEWIKYTYDEPLHLVPELDGVRIITNTLCEFLQCVPKCTEDIFRIGSCEPPALLYDAMEHYERKSPKGDENIRSIKDALEQSVEACIEASGEEFSPYMQKQLLRAAAYGKAFCEFPERVTDAFVDMCKTLRILNAVRHYQVGIPLTYRQYCKLTPDVLVDRLISRHNHLLALRICDYLKMRSHRVLVHWACMKVRKGNTLTDAELETEIVAKLASAPNISFAKIASTAHEVGRPHLATMLLNHEPRAADQVPLLINMQEDRLALTKAIESGDTDLVYMVMLHIKRNHQHIDFFRAIMGEQVAIDLFITYAKQTDPDLLKSFFQHMGRPDEMANIYVIEAYKQSELKARARGMELALQFYPTSKEAHFPAKATDDQLKLLGFQVECESALGRSDFIDTSLSETISKLTKLGEQRRVARLKSDFKVPDKRFWWLTIRALAEARMWDALERFSREKKSPIGYEPFADACIEQRVNTEAIKYIARISDPVCKARRLIEIGAWKEAAEAAFAAKHISLLQSIRESCHQRSVEVWIDQNLVTLTARK